MLNLTSADSSAPALRALTCKWIRTWNENDPLSTRVKAGRAPSQMFTPVVCDLCFNALHRQSKPRVKRSVGLQESHSTFILFSLYTCVQKALCHVWAEMTTKEKQTVLIRTVLNVTRQVKHSINVHFEWPSEKPACKNQFNERVQRANNTLVTITQPRCEFNNTVASSFISLAAVSDCDTTRSGCFLTLLSAFLSPRKLICFCRRF